MENKIRKVDDVFEEVATYRVDSRLRVTLGELVKDVGRVRVYKSAQGEILLQPVVEVPAAEAWLFQNPEGVVAVRTGLEDAAKGRITRIDPEKL